MPAQSKINNLLSHDSELEVFPLSKDHSDKKLASHGDVQDIEIPHYTSHCLA